VSAAVVVSRWLSASGQIVPHMYVAARNLLRRRVILDSNASSVTSRCAPLKHADAVVAPGDRVNIRAGTYAQRVTPTRSGSAEIRSRIKAIKTRCPCSGRVDWGRNL
jgi:hypothetical protein